MKIKGVSGKLTGEDYAGVFSWKTILDNVSVGDYVIAEVRQSYRVVKVTEITDKPSVKATKWVFQKVDTEVAKTMRSLAEEVKSLKDFLDEKIKKALEADRYAALAKNDPEAEKAINRLKELGLM